jgi:hypothetical protein
MTGCWTIFERYLAMTSSRIQSLLTANGLPHLFGRPTFALKRNFARFFLKTKLSPFLPSDMIEGGLCLLGQSNTQKSIWLDFASLDAYLGALGSRPHAVA